jgi:hypothetical protein
MFGCAFLLFFVCAVHAEEESVQFNRDVRYILSSKCFFCHGPDSHTRKADLRLDTQEGAFESVVVPGNPDESELIARITSDDEFTQMPPPDSGKTLSAGEIEILRRWIAQGAKYQKHWSLIPPVKAEPPASDVLNWDDEISRFVLRKLKEEGLEHSPPADKESLIRRVTLDITGLPPTAEEFNAFLEDDSSDAYERVVDRLLASNRYGEHQARFWLDAARYADTNGYQYDLEREQWVWRDWVIHAYNTNKPFDEFTIDQLAGDLLPNATDQQKLSTGFNRNHPITIEGGVIDEEYRTEYVIDRVVTTGTVWLGMTMLCSRCHDHKFDPIKQQDFYEFFAFFNQVPERGLNGFNPKLKIDTPLLSEEKSRVQTELVAAEAELKEQMTAHQTAFAEWEKEWSANNSDPWRVATWEEKTTQGGADYTPQDDGSTLLTGKNPETDVYVFTLDESAPLQSLRLEALLDKSHVNGSTGRGSNGNFVLSEVQIGILGKDGKFQPAKIQSATADYEQSGYPVTSSINGQFGRTGWAVDGNTRFQNSTAIYSLADKLTVVNGEKIQVRLHFTWGGSHTIGRLRLSTAEEVVRKASPAVAATFKIPADKRSPEQTRQLQTFLIGQFGDDNLKNIVAKVDSLRTQLQQNAAVPATMVMADGANRKSYILDRGEYDKKGEEVTANTPSFLPAMPENLPKNRLGLAKWLVSKEQPLTARVTVNRIWQRYFGNGIVKTTEDFGSQGSWPTHPDLLDWLAVEFMESGWDVKALHKRIVMSAVYQQSSNVNKEMMERDPENRLLARGPRLRLDAEVIRDSALESAGLLGKQIGGPSVFPYHPKGLWQEINNRPGLSRTYKQDTGDKLYRRSVYTFWKRTVPPPSMAAFDAPEREYCVVRRSRTNTPLQAFVMLHDPQFVESARHLAQRMLSEGGKTDAERIAFGFRLCVAREPSEAELSLLTAVLQKRLTQYQTDEAAAKNLLAVGDSPRDDSLDLATHAAYTQLARMMYNLSEFVTKP